MNKVYRVEHKIQKFEKYYCGTYGISGFIQSNDWQVLNHDKHRPIPSDDIRISHSIDWQGKYICGFSSLTKLKRWFRPKELERLNELGFVIAEYSYHDVMVGERQVLFIPKGKRKSIDILHHIG